MQFASVLASFISNYVVLKRFEFVIPSRIVPLGRRSHSSAARAAGPAGELRSRERNIVHVLRLKERHDDNSMLPLASGVDEFINRCL